MKKLTNIFLTAVALTAPVMAVSYFPLRSGMEIRELKNPDTFTQYESIVQNIKEINSKNQNNQIYFNNTLEGLREDSLKLVNENPEFSQVYQNYKKNYKIFNYSIIPALILGVSGMFLTGGYLSRKKEKFF